MESGEPDLGPTVSRGSPVREMQVREGTSGHMYHRMAQRKIVKTEKWGKCY